MKFFAFALFALFALTMGELQKVPRSAGKQAMPRSIGKGKIRSRQVSAVPVGTPAMTTANGEIVAYNPSNVNQPMRNAGQ
jgi:hypothetical protein